MFSRKTGHYPPESAENSLLAAELPLQQPPMCTGKALNFPDVLPAVKTKAKYTDIQSEYSQHNIRENYMKDKGIITSGFTTMQDSIQSTTKKSYHEKSRRFEFTSIKSPTIVQSPSIELIQKSH